MQTRIPATFLRHVLHGEPIVKKDDLTSREWLSLLLGLTKKLKHHFENSPMFRKLTEWLYDCTQSGRDMYSPDDGWHEDGNQENRNKAWKDTPLPKGITLDTKAVILTKAVLKKSGHGYSDILLTDQGTFLVWHRDSKGSHLDESIKSMELRYFTAREMIEWFMSECDAAYFMLFRLHTLLKANAIEIKRWAKAASKVRDKVKKISAMIGYRSH